MELEAEDVLRLEAGDWVEVEVTIVFECKLEAEEVFELDGATECVLKVEEVLELELELVFVLETELETDVILVDFELDDGVLVWLLETEVLELDGVLDALLETEELTVECPVVEWLLEELDGTVEWTLGKLLEVTVDLVPEEVLETIILLLLEDVAGLLLELETGLLLEVLLPVLETTDLTLEALVEWLLLDGEVECTLEGVLELDGETLLDEDEVGCAELKDELWLEEMT